jgi:hypothetical protein
MNTGHILTILWSLDQKVASIKDYNIGWRTDPHYPGKHFVASVQWVVLSWTADSLKAPLQSSVISRD